MFARIWCISAVLGVFLAVLGPARAELVLFEDFAALVPGPIDDQGGWQARHDTSVVTLDPANPDNQLMSVTTDSTWVYHPASLPQGAIRMLFVRFRFESQQNFSFGLSQSSVPDQFGEFQVELNMAAATTEFRVNDGGSYVRLADLTPGAWYNTWILVDNTSNQFRIYMHARAGEDASESDRLAINGQDVFAFRDRSSGDLRSFFIKTGGGSGPSGPLLIDDIHFEDTDAVLNLTNPVEVVLGDLNGDCTVDLTDLALLLSNFDLTPAKYEDGDVNADGEVSLTDLALLLAMFDAQCGDV